MEKYKGKVVGITEAPDSQIPGYLFILEMEDERELYTYNELATLQPLLNQEVVVDIAPEVISGKEVDVIREFGIISRIPTLDREDNIKLFSDKLPDTESDIIFEDIELGELVTDAVMYCESMEFVQSERSDFFRLVCKDKKHKLGTVRLFRPKEKKINYEGMYIQCTIRKDEYGFKTEFILPLPNMKKPVNPEIDIAAQYIYNLVQDDTELSDFVVQSGIVEKMKAFNYGEEICKGFETIRVAAQLAYAQETANISKFIDVKLLKRIIIASKAYVLTDNPDNEYDRKLQCILRVSKYAIGREKKFISILNGNGKKRYPEQDFYEKLCEMVEITLEAQKTGKYN